ncbi:hypothetical protein RchiOBHm_Chr3g0480861 [Rosa chinensis]|uniref:Uncharacterized protein n=1 Tax=Rosa chinensis TaxID=74649 RepID=A0A2P6RDT7_ROSCH|nr:hypothetical protein RchiOBHm_Chr3g0480861 [Rosa chinensis]
MCLCIGNVNCTWIFTFYAGTCIYTIAWNPGRGIWGTSTQLYCMHICCLTCLCGMNEYLMQLHCEVYIIN